MNFYKITISISTLAYAFFILSFPLSYYNDDSLFLARGIENFSVIDFSPHFPGYVSLILLGKVLNFFIHDIKESLFYLSSFCAIFTPFVIYLYVKKIQNEHFAFVAFLLSISSPYLNNFALSLLSDSVGFFFLFLGLYFLEGKKYKMSGFILAIALFARPSYFIFYLLGLIYIVFFKKEAVKQILIYFFLTTIVFFIYIYASNGSLYLVEGKRFLLGHFNIWGVGQNSSYSWNTNIFTLINLPYLLLLFSFFTFDKKLTLIYSFFIFYFIWIINYQNPENLRHLIPIIFLANIIVSQILSKSKILLIVFVIFNLFFTFSYTQKVSPFMQLTKLINKKENVLLSNHSIELLREYDFIVIDKYYNSLANYHKEENKNLISVTTNTKESKNSKVLYGRFIGERSIFYK